MNNNDIDFGLNSTGTYLNRIANYFKAMNKTLWSGIAKNDTVLTLPELTKYNIIAVNFELDSRWLLIERKPGTDYFDGSTVMVYPNWVALQDIALNSSDGINYRLSTSHHDIQPDELQPESTKYGIKAIVGVMPTPEKFGLGGGSN